MGVACAVALGLLCFCGHAHYWARPSSSEGRTMGHVAVGQSNSGRARFMYDVRYTYLRVPAIGQVNRANETIQCETCDRILEERYNDFRVAPVNIERESPYCVVTNDALAQHKSRSPPPHRPLHL